MAKKKKHTMAAQIEKDEQMPLIDVAPENAKDILEIARLYKTAEKERLAALETEVKLKKQIIELIRQANIPPDSNGKTTFKSGKVVITIEPRDELVKITEKTEKKKKDKKKKNATT